MPCDIAVNLKPATKIFFTSDLIRKLGDSSVFWSGSVSGNYPKCVVEISTSSERASFSGFVSFKEAEVFAMQGSEYGDGPN